MQSLFQVAQVVPENVLFFHSPIQLYCAKQKVEFYRKRLVRTVLIFTESSDQLSRATDRVPG
ncbi:hypothetical protein C9217_22980, partial [Escherichia coli]